MKKNIFLAIIFFFSGFLTHALFFPEVFSNGLGNALPEETINSILLNAPTTAPAQSDVFMTKVTYNGEEFNRHNLTIEVGSYLTITNTNKENKLMWLLSNNPQLATPRGYGKSEEIRVRMDEKGTFAVLDKNNPKERLVVTVK